MKALMMTADGFEDTELLVPKYRLEEEGVEVEIAAPETGTVTGKQGYEVGVDLPLDDVRAEDYDLLVLPGGHGPEKVRRNENALRVARAMMLSHEPVAAICHGIQTLISAQVVEGRNATCWPGIADDLKEAGAVYQDSEVVVDGRLVTSRKPEDLSAFCRELVRLAHRFKNSKRKGRRAGTESLAHSA